jgi:phosphohistidine phosphatase
MRELGLVPEVILVSSARRTLQTLEALTPLDGSPLVEPMDDLYLAPWPRLLDTLREVRETVRSALLIGHNPGLHELAMALAGPAAMATGAPMARRLAEGYPTATLCEFAIACPWQALEPGSARLTRFLTPAELPSAEPGDAAELTA